MSVTYGFYNSLNGDRTYNANQLSELFDGIIQDGVFMSVGDALMVSAAEGMNVNVGSGRAWFNHTWTNNDAPILLPIAQSEVVLNRIDTVVLEVNSNDDARANAIKIIKGTPSSEPVAKELIHDIFLNQYPLAYIYVSAGVTGILSANIENTIGTSDCPFVTGILETVDIDTLLTQWDGEFHDWIDQLEEILDENVAGNLLNLINANTGAIEAHEAEYAKFVANYEYQPPTIVGTQIRVVNQSDSNIVKFRLDEDLSGGEITITTDEGATSKPLVDINGEPVTELEKGFVEVVENAVNFTYAPKGAGLKIDALISEYEIEEGENINAGDLVRFVNNKARSPYLDLETASNSTISLSIYQIRHFALKLNNNKSISIGQRGTSSNEATAILSNNLDYHSVISSGAAGYIRGVKINDELICVVYSNNSALRCKILKVSGTSLVFSSEYVVYSNTPYNGVCIEKVSGENNLVAILYGNNYNQYLSVYEVSGMTMTLKNTINFMNVTNCSQQMLVRAENNKLLSLCRTTNQHYHVFEITSDGDINVISTKTTSLLINSASDSIKPYSLINNNEILYIFPETIENNYYLKGVYIRIDENDEVVLSNTFTITNHTTYTTYSQIGISFIYDNIYLLVYNAKHQGASYSTLYMGTIKIENDGSVKLINISSFGNVYYHATIAISKTKIHSYKYFPASGDTIRYELVQLNINRKIDGIATQNGISREIKKFYDLRWI